MKASETLIVRPAARFSEADSMGLIWSMEPAGGDKGAEPLHIDFDLEMNGAVAATARAQRLQVAPGVERIEIAENGVEGVLFLPAVGNGPHPTVIFLGGSEGGVIERDPALLASRGYGELPEWLLEIPLEYFDAAIGLVKRRLGVIGSSRGGEVALLLAAMHLELRAVVGRAASGVLWYGLPHDTAHGFRPTWTRNGEALPFMAGDIQPFEDLEADVEAGRPVSYAKAFARHLADDTEMLRRAEIPVERINAPILLISGVDSWRTTLQFLGEHIG